MPNPLTLEQLQKIVARKDEKACSWHDAVVYFGHDYEATRRALRKAGLWEGRKRRLLSPEDVAKIQAMATDEGLKASEIARAMNLPVNTVNHHVRLLNKGQQQKVKALDTSLSSEWLRRSLT